MHVLHELSSLGNQLFIGLTQLAINLLALGVVVLFQLVHSVPQIFVMILTRLFLQFHMKVVLVNETLNLPLHIVKLLRKFELSVVQ